MEKQLTRLLFLLLIGLTGCQTLRVRDREKVSLDSTAMHSGQVSHETTQTRTERTGFQEVRLSGPGPVVRLPDLTIPGSPVAALQFIHGEDHVIYLPRQEKTNTQTSRSDSAWFDLFRKQMESQTQHKQTEQSTDWGMQISIWIVCLTLLILFLPRRGPG